MASSSAPRRGRASVAFGSEAEVLPAGSATTHTTPFPADNQQAPAASFSPPCIDQPDTHREVVTVDRSRCPAATTWVRLPAVWSASASLFRCGCRGEGGLVARRSLGGPHEVNRVERSCRRGPSTVDRVLCYHTCSSACAPIPPSRGCPACSPRRCAPSATPARRSAHIGRSWRCGPPSAHPS